MKTNILQDILTCWFRSVKIIACCFLLNAHTSAAFSQGVMQASAGVTIKTSNNAFIVLNNFSIVNNGMFIQAPGDGTTKVTGNGNTTYSGSGNTCVDQLEMAVDSGYTHTLSSPLSIRNVLTITSGQLVSNGYLTLKSDAITTARLAPVISTITPAIVGNVTVERYIPGRRKYRMITSSVTTTAGSSLVAGQEALSIWGNWQNNGVNTSPNVGTIITGGTNADGFDTQTPGASLFTYNDSTRKYVALSSANGKNTKYTPLKAAAAYYMFVYGDRVNSVTTSSPNNTVIKASGTLLMGDQVFNTSSAIPISGVTGRFSMIGNPYASPINWGTILKTNLAATYWGWDPNLSNSGGYVTVHTSGTVTIISPYSGTTGINQYIQPGQGFFVKTTGASPEMIIREQDKVTTINNLAFTPLNVNTLPEMAVNLLYYTGPSKVLADGVVFAFDSSFLTTVGDEDAIKMMPSNESISIANGINLLSIDARPMPQNNDTLFLSLAKLTKPQYTLEIFGQQMDNTLLHPFLLDKYLNTSQALTLTDTNKIVFNVLASDSASFSPNRFKIVFRPLSILPLTFESVMANELNKQVKVEWVVAQVPTILKYEVQRSSDGTHFIKVGEVASSPNNASAERYDWLDVSPLNGNNYYRIRTLETDGKSQYSSVVLVKISAIHSELTIYPNPVKDNKINISLPSLDMGAFTVQIFNLQGQLVYKELFNHTGGILNKTISINKKLNSGMYSLEVINTKQQFIQPIFF